MADLEGFDVSQWQAGAYSGGGFSFGFAKATESIGYQDPAWTRHIRAILAQPIVPGAYHFARPDLDPGTAGAYAEADWFWRVVTAVGGAKGMLLALDLEVGGGQLGQWRDDFCGRLAWRLGGYQPGWYSYWAFILSRGLNSAPPYWSWLAWPDANGNLPSSSFAVSMQQYGLTTVPGITGQVDANRFFGSVDQLRALTVGGARPAPPPPIHGGSSDMSLALAARLDGSGNDIFRIAPDGSVWVQGAAPPWTPGAWVQMPALPAPARSVAATWNDADTLVVCAVTTDGAGHLNVIRPSQGWLAGSWLTDAGPWLVPAAQGDLVPGPKGDPGATYDDTAVRELVAAADSKGQRALDDLAAIAAAASK